MQLDLCSNYLGNLTVMIPKKSKTQTTLKPAKKLNPKILNIKIFIRSERSPRSSSFHEALTSLIKNKQRKDAETKLFTLMPYSCSGQKISNLVTDSKKKRKPGLFFFEYTQLPKLISNFYALHGPGIKTDKPNF